MDETLEKAIYFRNIIAFVQKKKKKNVVKFLFSSTYL